MPLYLEISRQKDHLFPDIRVYLEISTMAFIDNSLETTQ